MVCSSPLMTETMTGPVAVTCVVVYQGTWWYNDCHHSNLNGQYLRGFNDDKSVRWHTFNTTVLSYSLKWSEMKLK